MSVQKAKAQHVQILYTMLVCALAIMTALEASKLDIPVSTTEAVYQGQRWTESQ